MLCDAVFNDKHSESLLEFKQGLKTYMFSSNPSSFLVQATAICAEHCLGSRLAAVASGRICNDPTQQEKGCVMKQPWDSQVFCARDAMRRVILSFYLPFYGIP